MENKIYNLGEVFKDTWYSKLPWRVQLPKGRLPCRTKREAMRIGEAVKQTIRAIRDREVDQNG